MREDKLGLGCHWAPWGQDPCRGRERMTHFPVARWKASINILKTHMGPRAAGENVLCKKEHCNFPAFVYTLWECLNSVWRNNKEKANIREREIKILGGEREFKQTGPKVGNSVCPKGGKRNEMWKWNPKSKETPRAPHNPPVSEFLVLSLLPW